VTKTSTLPANDGQTRAVSVDKLSQQLALHERVIVIVGGIRSPPLLIELGQPAQDLVRGARVAGVGDLQPDFAMWRFQAQAFEADQSAE